MPHHLATPGARRPQAAAGRCSTSRRVSRPGSRPSAEHGSGDGALLHGAADEPGADASSSPVAARTVALSWSGHVPNEMELMQHLQLQLELVDSQCQNLYQQLDTVKQQQRAERHAAAMKLAAEQAHHAETMTELVVVSAELHALQSELAAARQALALSRPVQVTFVIGDASSSSSSSSSSGGVAAPGSKQPMADTKARATQQKRQSEPGGTRTAGAAVVVGELEAQHVAPVPVRRDQLLLLQQQQQLDGKARASEGGSIACSSADAAAAASIKRSASEPSSTCAFVPAPPSSRLAGGSIQAQTAACLAGNAGTGSNSSSCDISSMRATDGSKCSAGGVFEASAASEQPKTPTATLAQADKPGQQLQQQLQLQADRLDAESAAAMLRAPFNFCSSRVVPLPELVAEPASATKPTVTFSFTTAPAAAAKAKKKSSFSFRAALKQLKKPDTAPPLSAAGAARHSSSGGSRISEGGGRSSNSGGCSVIPIGRFVADSSNGNVNKISLLRSTRAFFSRSESCSAEVMRSSRTPAGLAPSGKRVAASNFSTMLGRFGGAKKVKN